MLVISGARGLTFGLNLHLHPNFVYVSSEDSNKSAHLGRLALGFVAQQCDRTKFPYAGSYVGMHIGDFIFYIR